MPEFNQSAGVPWEHWYYELEKLAQKHSVSVADQDAWMQSWEADQTPEQSLYEEYPELEAAEACVHKQHDRPCGECPWRKESAAGWLGAMQPGEFLALADSGHRMPCHSTVNYERADWKKQADSAPQCAGHAIFLANRCKQPAPGALKLPADREHVFSRPHEFVAHHANVPAASLETTMVWDLYKIGSAPKASTKAKRLKRPVLAD